VIITSDDDSDNAQMGEEESSESEPEVDPEPEDQEESQENPRRRELARSTKQRTQKMGPTVKRIKKLVKRSVSLLNRPKKPLEPPKQPEPEEKPDPVKLDDKPDQIPEQTEEEPKETQETEELSIHDLQSTSIDQLFARPIPNLQESLKKLLASNQEDIARLESLWNQRIHIKHKILEGLERIERKQEINRSGGQENGTASLPDYREFHKVCEEAVQRARQKLEATELKPTQFHQDLLASTSQSQNFLKSAISEASILGQGRQGPIKTVQSIIADFRQNNPQDIPRRGRRVKNSSGHLNNNSFDRKNNNGDYLMERGGEGLPEVSLYPVQQQQFFGGVGGGLGAMAGGGGQNSSSLLHGILTKVRFWICYKNCYNFREFLKML
jgi:hypothetical protein